MLQKARKQERSDNETRPLQMVVVAAGALSCVAKIHCIHFSYNICRMEYTADGAFEIIHNHQDKEDE